MYLLEGMPAPDHATIARFVSLHLSACSKGLLSGVTSMLYELGEISGKTVFIDGTKIESCANKYTFVWKKSVMKHQSRLFEKIVTFIEECETLYGIKAVYNGKATLHNIDNSHTYRFLLVNFLIGRIISRFTVAVLKKNTLASYPKKG